MLAIKTTYTKKTMYKTLLNNLALLMASSIASIATAGTCLPIDYQELKELPKDALLKELCLAKTDADFNKAHGDYLSLSAKMNRDLGDMTEGTKEGKKAIEAYEAKAICDKQVERIKRQLVSSGEQEVPIEMLCPAKGK